MNEYKLYLGIHKDDGLKLNCWARRDGLVDEGVCCQAW